jgi:parvulin-like peptidyl-prolyl isomerase
MGIRVDLTTPEGQARLRVQEKYVIDKLIEDEIVRRLARKLDVTVSEQEVQQDLSRDARRYGSLNTLRTNIKQLYDWDEEDYKEQVVYPALLVEKLSEKYQQEHPPSKELREKAEVAYAQLQGGKPFADVAREYSDGLTAQDGGTLGWFTREDLIPAVADAAFSQPTGQYGSIVESKIGYHIIFVHEKADDGLLVNISQILVRKPLFGEWLVDEMERTYIAIPLQNYYWDAQDNRVKTTDEETNRQEDQLELERYEPLRRPEETIGENQEEIRREGEPSP